MSKIRPWNITLCVLCVALLVGAGMLVAEGRKANADAAQARSRTAQLDRQRAVLAKRAAVDGSRVRQISAAALRLSNDAQQVPGALAAVTDAQFHLVQMGNRAVDLYNQGSVSASVAQLRSQADPALATLVAKAAALDGRLAAFRAAIAHLQEVLHG